MCDLSIALTLLQVNRSLKINYSVFVMNLLLVAFWKTNCCSRKVFVFRICSPVYVQVGGSVRHLLVKK